MKQLDLPAGTWINKGQSYWGWSEEQIKKIEEMKNAKYVGDFCLKTRDGAWAEEPVALFWQETPPVEGYSHYFGLFYRNQTLYVTGGQSAADEVMTGMIADSGEIIYSRYRHDYRVSADGTAMIDGGRDYVRSNMPCRPILLKIIGSDVVAVEVEE